MVNLKKEDSENTNEYIWRMCDYKDKGLLDLNWEQVGELINKELFGSDEELYRTSSAYRKPYQYAKDFYDDVFKKRMYSYDNEAIKKMDDLKRDIQKERIKLNTTRVEYNKWLRENARDELIVEEICKSISNLSPLEKPAYIQNKYSTKEYCLVFGDEHYGTEFELTDLLGNIINSYSPEIFEKRMWDLFYQVIDIIKKEDINTLNVYSMGDFSDGCLRVSQLMKLRYGVIDGTIKYANFISNWLNELTKYVRIRFQMTDGNHTELRMLGQPKGTFVEDNMGKIVKEFIKIRLEDNNNFTFIENPTGYIYDNLAGNIILGIHGETRSLEKTLKDLSAIYNTQIKYLFAGHLHHSKLEEIGINSEVINIPSIIGVDPYALSLNKASNASAKLFIFEEGKGRTCEYTFKLN